MAHPKTRPAVRLRAAPPLEPPFEDELTPETWAAGGGVRQLTLHLDGPGTSSGGRPAPVVDPAADLPPDAVAAASPEAQQATRRFLHACLEILNGYRPIGHVRALAGAVEGDRIIEQLRIGGERMAGPYPADAPRRTAPRPGRSTVRVRLRRLRVCEPQSGVAEAAAVLDTPGRTWAMAFRLERRRGSWLGTTVRVL